MKSVMYHGTTESAYKNIDENGFNTAFVYLTNDFDLAAQHADSDDFVVEVVVNVEDLGVDYDFANRACPSIVDESARDDVGVEEFFKSHGQYAIESSKIIQVRT